jgi:hypothetical protein
VGLILTKYLTSPGTEGRKTGVDSDEMMKCYLSQGVVLAKPSSTIITQFQRREGLVERAEIETTSKLSTVSMTPDQPY